MTIPALFDPMGPSNSDPVLPPPADHRDLHEQGPVLVAASFACPPGLEIYQGERPTEGRSLPPARRSPGRPRSRDGPHSLQYAQMVEMMKAMTHELKQVKSQVGKLQQNVNLFSFRPSPVFSDSDDG